VENAIGHFNARNGRDGLFLHDARSRAREFWTRLSMTLLGACAIAAFGSVKLGIVAALVALTGAILDCAVLMHILRHAPGGVVPVATRGTAFATAILQAITIAVCVAICWRSLGLVEAKFFAAAFLMSVVINAGLVRRHFPEGSSAKLAVYVLPIAILVSDDLSA